jgi:hypothetical protein
MAAARKKKKKESPKKVIPTSVSNGLTEIEMKLLTLALDGGAYEGESDNAAIMFVRKLRARNVKADELFGEAGHKSASKAVVNYGNTKMTFGKYRNEMIKDIPINYLIWVLDNCMNISPKLKLAIQSFVYE